MVNVNVGTLTPQDRALKLDGKKLIKFKYITTRSFMFSTMGINSSLTWSTWSHRSGGYRRSRSSER
jgi:hypothetical protein